MITLKYHKNTQYAEPGSTSNFKDFVLKIQEYLGDDFAVKCILEPDDGTHYEFIIQTDNRYMYVSKLDTHNFCIILSNDEWTHVSYIYEKMDRVQQVWTAHLVTDLTNNIKGFSTPAFYDWENAKIIGH